MVWFRAVLLGYLAGYLSGFWTFYNTTTTTTTSTTIIPNLGIEGNFPVPPCPNTRPFPIRNKKFKDDEINNNDIEVYESSGGGRSSSTSTQTTTHSIKTTTATTTSTSTATNAILSSSSSTLSLPPLLPTTTFNDTPPKVLAWWKRHVLHMTRVYTPWNGTSTYSWCIPEELNHPSPVRLVSGTQAVGLLYIKSYKTASSTLEGICLSIAHNIARRHFGVSSDTTTTTKSTAISNSSLSLSSSSISSVSTTTAAPPPCIHYNRHEFADSRHHARRGTPSLLWSFVRDPAKRDLSHVFHFEVGRRGMIPTDDLKIINTIEYRIKGRQVRYLIPHKGSTNKLWPKHELRQDLHQVLHQIQVGILDNYDFLGVTERMEESLACLVILFQLHPGDVIVLPSKRSGGYDDAGHNQTCTRIPKAIRTPAVEHYLSHKFVQYNADVLLYHVVNASLDRTIAAIGLTKVQEMVQEIQYLQRLAEQRCQDVAHFPCSENGTLQLTLSEQSCYVQDAGCGHACVDAVMEKYRRHEEQK
jgi:hypothetical protein